MISALSELAIPHFTSASIFAAAEAKQRHTFDAHLKKLLVRSALMIAGTCWHGSRAPDECCISAGLCMVLCCMPAAHMFCFMLCR